MPLYLKIINVFFLATFRYFITPIFAFLIKLNLTATIITMVSGGVTSFIFFFYFTKVILTTSRFFKPLFLRFTPQPWIEKHELRKARKAEKRKHRKKFTRKNKQIIKIRRIFGFWGIIITTPTVLSIPLGAFLMHRYYRKTKGALLYPVIAIIVEGIIICFLYYLIPGLRP